MTILTRTTNFASGHSIPSLPACLQSLVAGGWHRPAARGERGAAGHHAAVGNILSLVSPKVIFVWPEQTCEIQCIITNHDNDCLKSVTDSKQREYPFVFVK